MIEELFVLPQSIQVRWNSRNKMFYTLKGYRFTKMKEQFEVDILDVLETTRVLVKCICQYCYKECKRRLDKTYLKKDVCCDNCVNIKKVQTNLKKYGVEYPIQLNEIKEKRENNNFEKYGVKNTLQLTQVKEQRKQTNLKKYGVEHYSKTAKFKQQARENIINMNKENKIPTSKQQKHLHELLGGIINHNQLGYFLDIAFEKEMIYIEYDGSGHDLSLKFGCDEKKFSKKEIERQNILNLEGWKIIRIISKHDYLPIDEQIIFLIDKCKEILKFDYSWIVINIDEQILKYKNHKENLDFLLLRKIKK